MPQSPPSPGQPLLHYEVPETLTARVVPGARVVVPLRRERGRDRHGSRQRSAPAGVEIKPIMPPRRGAAISPPLLELGRWMSDYYGAPLGSRCGDSARSLWSVARPAARARRERCSCSPGTHGVPARTEQRFKRAPKRRVVYETVEALGGSAPVAHLVKQLKLSSTALEGLVKQGSRA